MSEQGIEHGTSGTAVRCVTSRPPRKLSVPVADKVFNCLNVMGQNITQSHIFEPHL